MLVYSFMTRPSIRGQKESVVSLCCSYLKSDRRPIAAHKCSPLLISSVASLVLQYLHCKQNHHLCSRIPNIKMGAGTKMKCKIFWSGDSLSYLLAAEQLLSMACRTISVSYFEASQGKF